MDGRITERGTHDELIAKGGVYKKLYALQFRENDLIE
jgi:ABC-type multidrug transport system fused ATPase/permease subunit